MNTIVVNGAEQEVALEDLLELEMEDVKENYGGFTLTPRSVCHWRCANAELVKMGKEDQHLVIAFSLECVRVIAVSDNEDGLDEETMVGFKHNENIFIRDAEKDIGKAKGLMANAGLEGKGKLKALLKKFVGCEFVAKITHAKNKNDPDKPYVNMDIKGVKTVAEYEAATA